MVDPSREETLPGLRGCSANATSSALFRWLEATQRVDVLLAGHHDPVIKNLVSAIDVAAADLADLVWRDHELTTGRDDRDVAVAVRATRREPRLAHMRHVHAHILLAGGLAQWRVDPHSPPGRSDARRLAVLRADQQHNKSTR
jgi:hypothetical protein